MYRLFNIFFSTTLISGILFFSGTPAATAQDELPAEIHASVFFLSQETMMNYLKEGITRAELDDMQYNQFKQNGLLPKGEPVILKEGENNITIPAEQIDSLREASGPQVIVFFFGIQRPEESSGDSIPISRRSYSLSTGTDTEIKEIQVKEGHWMIPEKIRNYRLFDFRFASFLNYPQAVYELNLEQGGETKTLKLVLNVPQD